MEKVGEDKEKTTIEEASNSVEETRSDKEDEEKTVEEASNSVEETRSDKDDERIRGEIVERFDYTEEGSTDQSNSKTVNFEDHDVNEDEMEDEKVLELFRRKNSLRPQVGESNNFLSMNKSEDRALQFQEDTPAETEQTDAVHSLNEIADLGAMNQNSPELLEGTKSSSASDDDTDDSSSNLDLDYNLSRYYFDGSLPVSTHVEETETHQDETKMPLLCPKQPVQRTPWRNCCGLLELLRAAEP